MIHKISNWFNKISVGWVALLFLIIFFVYTSTEVISQKEKADQYQGEVGSIDLNFWYTAEDVFEMAEFYGEEGRNEYIHSRLSFDVIFPLLYTAFLVTTISFLGKVQFGEGDKFLLLNWVPIIGMIFDFLENGLGVLIMNNYPERLTALASISPFVTMLKWVFVSGSFVLVIILGLRAAFVKISNK